VADYDQIGVMNMGEAEVLLPRNARFRVKGIRHVNAEEVAQVAAEYDKPLSSVGRMVELDLELIV
jgi:hypothetical protein